MTNHRIDGVAKVRGAKIYGSDFLSRDMPGWPTQTSSAYLLRAGYADRTFQGIDRDVLGSIEPSMLPARVVTAADLAGDKINSPLGTVHPATGLDLGTKPGFFGLYWLTPEGAMPDHVGQPVAMLIFTTALALRDFSEWVRVTGGLLPDGRPLLRFGPKTKVVEQDIRKLVNPLLAVRERDEEARYGSIHFIREQKDAAADTFSLIVNGPHDPWRTGPAVPPKEREVNAAARDSLWRITRRAADEGLAELRRTFYTQSTDPMFMETESGIAWMERATGGLAKLHIVAGTQSPRKDREAIAAVFADNASQHHVTSINLTNCYPGGGFGGRDASSFPVYLALAAAYASTPVRLSFDRYEQFLCGIKRHAAVIESTLAFNAKNGKLHTLISSAVMDGGGLANLTQPVIELCALHSAGPYRFEHTAVSAYGISTDGAPAGSMRGFGIPQAAFALESMIDEVAASVGADPIALRIHQTLEPGDRDVTGMTLTHHLGTKALCEIALAEPLWQNRHQEKQQRDRANLRYGVGFACCMEAMGTSHDAVFAEVSFDPVGAITVRSTAVDMGQGSATSLATATVNHLGRSAQGVELGLLDRFDVLGMTTKISNSANPYASPRYTPKIDNTMSASITAFHHLHAVEQACQVLIDHGLKPVAEEIWGGKVDAITWEGGAMTAPGFDPIPFEQLAARAHADGRCVGAVVHTYFKGVFTRASFEVDGVAHERFIDALAILKGGGDPADDLVFIERKNVVPPDPAIVRNFKRSVYASVGHIVAVEVHTGSGLVNVTDCITILDAGDVHHRQLLEGQVEGGLVMGLGMALLEEIPPAPEGVDGGWNLNRYYVARASHVPIGRVALRMVPLGDKPVISSGPPIRKKGIAEAVMTTVPPAVANAITHATGARLNALPFTPERVLEALNS
jgi:CO/xanthine dehydrogenase Mo-binding subunit